MSIANQGMLLVLLVLCVVFSVLTWKEQHPAGSAAASGVAHEIRTRFGPSARVVIVSTIAPDDLALTEALDRQLSAGGSQVLGIVKGQPADASRLLTRLNAEKRPVQVIAVTPTARRWEFFTSLDARFPNLGRPEIVIPRPYHWPVFLNSSNLLNIANQIAVIAIVAIGMTLVIIAGGIDLSVGSLIALSAVVSTLLIREFFGREAAGPLGMLTASLCGIALCGLIGVCSGAAVTFFRVPAFIVTLSVMLMASGLAYSLTSGQSVNQVPPSFGWLGIGADLLGIPNAVVLMLILYAGAHSLMATTVLGRYLYAVGGNAEAARLSGVPVPQVVLFAYAASGALAGLGGVVMASQFQSGSPTYGQSYELYTIAAVVVGGASLSGGEGRIFGTLTGALIIGVIRNGMNLWGIEPYTQTIVLGAVILGAVLLDQVRRRETA